MSIKKTTVHAALGKPLLQSHVPRDRHSWRDREFILISALPLHLQSWRFRSWRTLWRLLHQEEPPRQEPSWAALCCNTLLNTLADTLEVALTGDSSSGFFSWNVRWLRDPHTTTNLHSKAVIQRQPQTHTHTDTHANTKRHRRSGIPAAGATFQTTSTTTTTTSTTTTTTNTTTTTTNKHRCRSTWHRGATSQGIWNTASHPTQPPCQRAQRA